MNKTLPLVVVVAIMATVTGYAFYQTRYADRADARTTARLLRLTLPDVYGKPVKLALWADRVLVVNFWATWCEPCREEIPALMRTQSRFAASGLQIVGIAVDSAPNVSAYISKFGVSYPVVIGGAETIDVARELGNRDGALPYTVVIDRKGKVAITRLGGISEAELEGAIRPLL